MIRSIGNNYQHVFHIGKRKDVCAPNIKHKEFPKDKNCDVIEISKDGLTQLQKQEEQALNIDGETETLATTLQPDEEEGSLLVSSTEEELQETEENPKETSQSSGMIGINAGKLARKLATAKTKAQVQAIIAEVQQDLAECEAGRAQGMTVDEASVQAAQNVLNQANQRLGEVEGREATPEEEMAFALAGLM